VVAVSLVSLGGVYADPDDADAARISKLIRSTMTRLHVDINRSIAYYRTTLNGAPPKRVFLTGGSSQLPYLDLFIADKLSLPVTYFNPLRNVTLAPTLNTAQLADSSCYTGELVGLALRETGACPAEISLDAPTLAARSDKKRKQPFFFAALFAWIVVFACLSAYYFAQNTIAQQMGAALDQKVNSANGLKTYANKITTLAGESESLQATLNQVVTLGKQRTTWPEILVTLNDKMPHGVWITELTPVYDPKLGGEGGGNENGPGGGGRGGRGGRGQGAASAAPGARANVLQTNLSAVPEINELVVNGLYHANPKTEQIDSQEIDDFVSALAETPYFDIDTKKLTDTLVSLSTADTNPGYFAQNFTLHLKLKEPISLRP
jgi:type IV pilus assembly protein PilM